MNFMHLETKIHQKNRFLCVNRTCYISLVSVVTLLLESTTLPGHHRPSSQT